VIIEDIPEAEGMGPMLVKVPEISEITFIVI
jgi:hypothetical protein